MEEFKKYFYDKLNEDIFNFKNKVNVSEKSFEKLQKDLSAYEYKNNIKIQSIFVYDAGEHIMSYNYNKEILYTNLNTNFLKKYQ